MTWSVLEQLCEPLCLGVRPTQLYFPAVTPSASSGCCSRAWLLCCNRRINPAGFAPGFVMSRWDGRRGGGIHHVLAGVLLVSAASSVHKIAPVELNMVFLCAPESVWTHITEPAGGIYMLSLKCYAFPERTVLGNIPWEKPYLSSAPWRKERVEEQVEEPGRICPKTVERIRKEGFLW